MFGCSLRECPPGLFLFNGTLGFKSEYRTTNKDTGFAKTDAYVVLSGEYFWGNADSEIDREKLTVTPVQFGKGGGLQILQIETE